MIPVYEPRLDGNEQRYLSEAIASGWVSSEGPFVERFEMAMAQAVDRCYGVAVSSGTMALQVALQALDLAPGTEVILPTFTIISVALAVIRCGYVPVLVDCKPNTFNMDPVQVAEKITPKTRAIVMVHTYGLPCEINALLGLALKHNLFVIEDAAQMHGQTYYDRPCGSFGDVSIFSFYANKLITTGEGGMVLTDQKGLADRCRRLRDLDHHPQRRFLHDSLGWNARMTNVQAAIGCAQLERLGEFVTVKRAIGARYNELLNEVPATVQVPQYRTDYARNIYWAYGIATLDPHRSADTVIRALQIRGIQTRPFFVPMHRQPAVVPYLRCAPDEASATDSPFPVADRLADDGLYLPGGLTLTCEDQERVVAALREVLT
jgi:perosamine synthetase